MFSASIGYAAASPLPKPSTVTIAIMSKGQRVYPMGRNVYNIQLARLIHLARGLRPKLVSISPNPKNPATADESNFVGFINLT